MPRKPTEKPTRKGAVEMLLNPTVPIEMRVELLKSLLFMEGPHTEPALRKLLEAASAPRETGKDRYAKKIRELAGMIAEMSEGPLRLGTFLKMVETTGADGTASAAPRAQTLLPDGSTAFPVVADAALAPTLRAGDEVWLEAQGRALLYRGGEPQGVGEVARLERRLPDGHVEVSLRDQVHSVHFASARLEKQMDDGEASPGDPVLVCPLRNMAFAAIPREDGLAHYRFLHRGPVPDVVVDRDIACPPAFLEQVIEHVETELHNPDLHRKYGIRPPITVLLTGGPGTGKTFCIDGFQNSLYALMSEATGIPVDELPPRVMHLRSAEILSKWLGDSDRALDRYFNEVEELASRPYVDPKGREWRLPVLCIFEEIDGLARTRGGDQIYDRIQTVLLQRLDVCAGNRLRDLPVVCFFTTNTPQLVDPAFIRRAGGTIHRFESLTGRTVFRAVLDRILKAPPVRSAAAHAADEARVRILDDVTSWLFSPNGQTGPSQAGEVEITYVGQTTPVVKHRRDFLTPGLVDRAVQQALRTACREERQGSVRPGVSSAHVIRAISDQVRSIVARLNPENVGDYVTIPDGARAGAVRRLPAATILSAELERAG